MYYVPDGTQMCGYYECEECGNRFLSLTVRPQMVCPACGEQPDMEIGPDAKLLQVIQGEDEVEKMDALISLAVTGGNEEWI